jgi:AcrR family transcriptional regulator
LVRSACVDDRDAIAGRAFVAQVEKISADMDVAEQLVEVVAYIIERLPREPQLALLLANDRSNSLSRNMLGRTTIARCRTILLQTHIKWADLGYDDHTIDELVEFLLRTIQSMVVAPPEPPRSSADLRAYLHRWIGPALTQANP